MKASSGTLAFGLLLSVVIPAGAAMASDPGEQIMLERANYWRSQQRLDLAGDILNKLLAVNPSQPDALYENGVLAIQQGRPGEAAFYFDRLRFLAPSDTRAAELVGMVAELPAAAPIPATDAAPRARQVPALTVASADSDDLIPAKPAAPAHVPPKPPARPSTPAMAVDVRREPEVAPRATITVSDADTTIPVTPAAARPADSADLGVTAKKVQVAQVELQPPPPIDGYQWQAAITYSPDDTLEMQIDRNIDLIAAQSNPTLIAGAGFRGHSGDDGLDRLNEVGASVEGSFSPWYTGIARLAVLPVYLDADGSVDSSELSRFGANPILSAKGLPLVSSGDQNASGVGILGGYALGDFSGQFGTSPLGFPVTNLIGNVAYAPKFFDGTLTVRFEGLRRPVTDSVLSYAGTHASLGAANAATGNAFGGNEIWGGVVKTGGHVTVYYDNQIYGAYGGAGLASVTGQNVTQNNEVDALLGTYYRPWKYDDWSLRVGISTFYAGYNRNLDGFTFGQGGYFSPQNYIALTFPVEYMGHSNEWSWLASAALGVQHFNTDSSPIFPHNSGAQAVLVGLEGNSAFIPGQTETGPAFNIKGQIEYAIDSTLAIGASAARDNANNYVEGIGKIYLRKTFDWFSPIAKSDPNSIVARDQPMSRL